MNYMHKGAPQYKFATQILYYDCEQFILRAIENTGPFVEKIYILYSKLPYSKYNKNAVHQYPNPSNVEILKESKYSDKIEIIENVWHSEEEQRNEGLTKAKNDGIDFLIIQDADEFYNADEFQKNLHQIAQNPNYPYYRNPWIFYWKSPKYSIKNFYPIVFQNWIDEGPLTKTDIAYNACFAVNCNKDVWFNSRRMPEQKGRPFMLDGLCHHLSFVLNDEQLFRKLNTWSHTQQVANIRLWYKVSWKGWKLGMKNLHPIDFIQFNEAVTHNNVLPKEIQDFDPGVQTYVKPGTLAITHYKILVVKSRMVFMMRDVVWVLKKYLQSK